MIRLELPEYGARAKNLGQHNRARKARQQWGERRSIVRGSKDGIRKGGKGTNQDFGPEKNCTWASKVSKTNEKE